MRTIAIFLLVAGLSASFCVAQTQPVEAAPVAGRVVAVTVYRGSALVTREVEVGMEAGVFELIVSPLPAQTLDNSLYTEGTDGIRILSTRYRTRAVRDDAREAVRAKEEEINDLQTEAQQTEKYIAVIEQNLQFIAKLENFTAVTMEKLSEKGVLSSDSTIALGEFVMVTRESKSKAQVEAQQNLSRTREAIAFAQRELNELAAGTSRTERDAVIVVDKANAGAGTVRLSYLVGSATWSPQYKFRAASDEEPIQVEYLAAVVQQSGEDWTDVNMVLSTAEPMLNAAPPELFSLDVSVGAREESERLLRENLKGNADKSKDLRQQAQKEFNEKRDDSGGSFANSAAAMEQTQELLAIDADEQTSASPKEGPTVTYHLKTRFNIPSRADEQLIEVAQFELDPEHFYKAVPVLTPHVYRLANLANKSEYVLLGGEATMYQGADFVGQMNLPLVAIGEKFTVGFGVDPQIQVDRQLVTRTRSIQGGKQVHTYEYKIRVSSFKDAPLKLQVWDRLPRGEAEAVNVTVGALTPEVSQDAEYLRVERPKNLLRWDLELDANAQGDKAALISYQFRMEYDRNLAISDLKAAK